MAEQERLMIEITSGHCLGGEGNDVYAGQVLVAPRDLSVADARKKVRMGYARVIPSAPEAGPDSTEASGPAFITHPDPVLESRDPVIEAPDVARRGRSRTGGR